MSLVKYANPWSPATLFNKDEFLTPFSTLYDDFFNDSFDFLGKDFFERGTYPKVDVRNEEKQMVIEAEVPGLKKENVRVELEGGILRIKGEKKETDEKKANTYVHRELKHSSFCRSFSIGKNIDAEKITSKFENGVLEITLPKLAPDPKPTEVKQIAIQ
jgi:HSP20 family protein